MSTAMPLDALIDAHEAADGDAVLIAFVGALEAILIAAPLTPIGEAVSAAEATALGVTVGGDRS